MNFSQLQYLVALVDTGSFTEAADAVDLTQSAVSHSLTTLERELRVTERFHLSKRAVKPRGFIRGESSQSFEDVQGRKYHVCN